MRCHHITASVLNDILFIYFWLLSTGFLWLGQGGATLRLGGASFSFWWLLSLGSAGSGAVAHSLSCSRASGVFPDQRWNPSQPPVLAGGSLPAWEVPEMAFSTMLASGRGGTPFLVTARSPSNCGLSLLLVKLLP